MLFVTAIACLGTAVADASLGWFIGGIILLFIAIYAFRQGKKELDTGRETASNSFIIFALLTFLIGFAAIVFLATT